MPARVNALPTSSQQRVFQMESKLSASSGRVPFRQSPAFVPTLLTPRETADHLKLSVSWLAKRRLHGDGPAYIKVGRSVRYQEPALLQWMKSRQRLSTSEA